MPMRKSSVEPAETNSGFAMASTMTSGACHARLRSDAFAPHRLALSAKRPQNVRSKYTSCMTAMEKTSSTPQYASATAG